MSAARRTVKSGSAPADLPVRMFRNQGAWETWLEKNGTSSPGLWLRIAKKSSKLKSVNYDQALESALCHGWIDGLRKSHDDDTFIQRFTPRRLRSMWSKINCAKALGLIEDGRMKAGGHAAIERAKQNGRWDAAYDSHRTAGARRSQRGSRKEPGGEGYL